MEELKTNISVQAEDGAAAVPLPPEGRKKKRFKWNVNYYGIVFIIPFFVVYAIFSAYPMVYSVILSLTDYEGYVRDFSIIGFETFAYLLHQPRFWYSFYNTVIMFLMNFIPQLVLGLMFAAMFTSKTYKMKLKGLFKGVYYLPNIITATSVAVMFFTLFQQSSGGMWRICVQLGIIEDGYNFYLYEWPSRILVAFVSFWQWFGSMMVTLSAGILGINPSVYEAAELDGANQRQAFFHVTLPLIRPIVVYCLVTSTIGGLQGFDIPYLFLGGGPALTGGRNATETVAVYIYKTAFDQGGEMKYNVASAASVYLFIVCAAVSILLFRLTNVNEERQAKRAAKKIWGGDRA